MGGLAGEGVADENKAKPDFALRDMNGVAHRLSQYRGKWVVLEWIGFDCEPVNEHYRVPARKVPSLQQATHRADDTAHRRSAVFRQRP